MSTFEETLQRHCARAVPFILIDNAIDELATVNQVLEAVRVTEDAGHDLLFLWSMSDGLQVTAGNASDKFAAAERYLADAKKKDTVGGGIDALTALLAIKEVMILSKEANRNERSAFVFFMGDRVLNPQDNDRCNQCVQVMLDIRNTLKSTQSCIYMVGIDFNVPKELKEHIVMLQAPLPNEKKYEEIIDECYDRYRAAKLEDGGKKVKDLPADKKGQFIETLKGMSEFAAEQTVYLSTDMDGMHIEEMRQRAIQTINATRGLSVYKGDGRGFAAIGGLNSIKDYSRSLIGGKLKVKLVCFIDELEKVIGGSGGGDTSGVSQNYLGTLLSEMQDTNALGMLLTGVYGTGKSEVAKRFGEEAETLTIHVDLAGMKDSLVGNSEANLRRAMNVIRSIGGEDGGIVYMATCNRISQLPPELKRRFNLGTFFFYFPDAEERTVIWDIYRTKFGLMGDTTRAEVLDDKWTGAEIESCCRLAYLMNCTIAEASARIVPVATTAKEDIDRLVDEGNGRFLSCSTPGVFIKPSPGKQYLAENKTEGRRTSFN